MATPKQILASVDSLANSKNPYVIERAKKNLQTHTVSPDSKETFFTPNVPSSANPTRHEIFLKVGSETIKYEGQTREQLVAEIKASGIRQGGDSAGDEAFQWGALTNAESLLAFFEQQLTQADCHFSAEALSSVLSRKAAENPELPPYWPSLHADTRRFVRVVPKKVTTTIDLYEKLVTNIEDGYFVGYRVPEFDRTIFEIEGQCTTTYSADASQKLTLTKMAVQEATDAKAASDAKTVSLLQLINSKSVSELSVGENSTIMRRAYAEMFNQSDERKAYRKAKYGVGTTVVSLICVGLFLLIPVIGQTLAVIAVVAAFVSMTYTIFQKTLSGRLNEAALNKVSEDLCTPVPATRPAETESGQAKPSLDLIDSDRSEQAVAEDQTLRTTPLALSDRHTLMVHTSAQQSTYAILMQEGAPLASTNQPVAQTAAPGLVSSDEPSLVVVHGELPGQNDKSRLNQDAASESTHYESDEGDDSELNLAAGDGHSHDASDATDGDEVTAVFHASEDDENEETSLLRFKR